MELVQIYYIGELVGVAVIVGSLLFVGAQMRQNANALRVSATAASVSNWQGTVLEIAGSEHVAPALARIGQATDPNDLELVDTIRITGLLIAAAKNTEFAYYRHKANEITDGLWEAACNGLSLPFAAPMMKAVIWPRVKLQLSSEFAAYMDKTLSEREAQLLFEIQRSDLS